MELSGNPRKAAEFAWRDAFLTHRKNGMYGEIFFSAVEAAAFTEDSIDDLIKICLQYIPQNCRFFPKRTMFVRGEMQ